MVKIGLWILFCSKTIRVSNTNVDFGGSNLAPADHDHYVYIHTSPNGKKYVGITKQIPEVRWNYGCGYHNNTHFYRAIKKYGWNNFKHEIVASGLTKNEALHMEIDLIKKFNSFKNGYDLSFGGEGLPGMPLPKTAYDESTKKNSKRIAQFTITGEYIASYKSGSSAGKALGVSSGSSILECAKGNRPYAYGYLWAYEGNDPIIPKIIPEDYLFGEEESYGKPIPVLPMCKRKNGQYWNKITSIKVTQYDLSQNKIRDWESMAQAARFVGCDEYEISKCVRGKQHTSAGFYWAKQGEQIKSLLPENYSVKRTIYQIDPDTREIIGIFESLQDAENRTGVLKQSISNVCNQLNVMMGGFYWMYKDKPYEIKERYQSKRKKVKCITTNEIFDSMTIAAKHFGFSRGGIEACCQKRYKQTHGLEFEYA